MRQLRRLAAFLASLALLGQVSALGAEAGPAESAAVFTFTEDGVTASGNTDGCTYSDSGVTIGAPGTYTVTGSRGEGSVEVKREVTGVTLILRDLSLSSSVTAPLLVGKGAAASLDIRGTVALTDRENPGGAASPDAAVAGAFQGAAVRLKDGAALSIGGSGVLRADGSACQDGIAGAAGSSVTIGGVTVQVTAAGDGISCPGGIRVTGGTVDVTAGKTGLLSQSAGGGASAGTVAITGGGVTVNAGESAVFGSEGVSIGGGTLHLTAGAGREAGTADGSARDASGRDAVSACIRSGKDVSVTGGVLTLDAAEDGIHAAGNAGIAGGTLTVRAGGAAFRAAGALSFGVYRAGQDAAGSGGPVVTVADSREGFRGARVLLHGGQGTVTASGDGIRAEAGAGEDAVFINGGRWTIDAAGNGLDAGGDDSPGRGGFVYVNGGVTELYGAPEGREAALDFGSGIVYRGGTLLAVDVTGMDRKPAEGVYVCFSGGSRDAGGALTLDAPEGGFSLPDGSDVEIRDGGGHALYAFTGRRAANSVLFCSEAVRRGEAYTLVTGGTAAASASAAGTAAVTNRNGVTDDDGQRFRDVPPDLYCFDAVNWAVGAGVTTGRTADTFDPEGTCTRGQAATFLWRAAGQPEPSGTANPFHDVTTGAYYYKAVLWAAENGITTGKSGGTEFAPNEKVTRGQAVTFLYRAVKGTAPGGTGPAFLDVSAGSYCYDALNWAASRHITMESSGAFRPGEPCTRGVIVTLLFRCYAG